MADKRGWPCLGRLVQLSGRERGGQGSAVVRARGKPRKELALRDAPGISELLQFEAFGWKVLRVNGHVVGAVLGAIDAAAEVSGRPTLIVADTVKGKGVPFAEDTADFHNAMMTHEQYDEALAALDRQLAAMDRAR